MFPTVGIAGGACPRPAFKLGVRLAGAGLAALLAAPDEVRAFASATAKSVRYAIDHPEEAARILVAHNPTLDPELMLEHWRQSIGAIETAYVAEHGYGHATLDRLQRSIDLVKKAFELEEALTPDDIFADGFMPR